MEKLKKYISPSATIVELSLDGLLCLSKLNTEDIQSSGNTIDWDYMQP